MKFLATVLLTTQLAAPAMPQHYDPQVEPTPDMIQEAKRNPNGWVYVIQGNFGPDDAVPPQAIAGAWRVDGSGNIIAGSYVSNPNFRPAP